LNISDVQKTKKLHEKFNTKMHTGRWSISLTHNRKKMIVLFQFSFRTSSLQIAYFPSLTDALHVSVEFLFQNEDKLAVTLRWDSMQMLKVPICSYGSLYY
jgi:hypothetical protein